MKRKGEPVLPKKHGMTSISFNGIQIKKQNRRNKLGLTPWNDARTSSFLTDPGDPIMKDFMVQMDEIMAMMSKAQKLYGTMKQMTPMFTWLMDIFVDNRRL